MQIKKFRPAIGMTLSAFLLYGCSPNKQTPESPEEKAATEARFQDCKKKIAISQSTDLLYNIEFDHALPPVVVVGRLFNASTYDVKQGFANTLNCAFVGGRDEYIDFDLVDMYSHKRVAQYHWGKLEVE